METQPPPLAADAAAPAPMSTVARLMNVLAAPGEVFDEVRSARHSVVNWLVPGLILILVGWLGGLWTFSQPRLQQQLREVGEKSIEKQIARGHYTEQQIQQMRQLGDKLGGIMPKIGAYGMPIVIGLVLPFIWGLFIWVAGSKILNGGFSYMKGVEVVGLANMIAILGSIIRTLLVTIKGNVFVDVSPTFFLQDFDPQNPVHGLMSALNLMTFWVLAVRASGLAKLSRISYLKAVLIVFGIWIAYTAFFTSLGFLAQAAAAKH
jgi:hypothetical protein